MTEEWSKSFDEWKSMMNGYPILQMLYNERVFSVGLVKDGRLGFIENCDEHFSCSITVDQVRALARELEALANEAARSS